MTATSPPAPEDLPSLALMCFGSPTATVGGAEPPPDVVWRKHLALLLYLALSPKQERSRDHLLGILWPEKPEPQARHSLNEAVRRLRVGLGGDRLRTRGDVLALNPDGLSVDALRFVGLTGDRPEEAVALLTGDFLEGFHLDDAPGFEEWSALERHRWRSAAAGAWVSTGEKHLAAGRRAEAADAGRQALAFAPSSEPAVRLVMRAVALSGDATGALAVYHDFALRLSQETGEAPGRELQALAERMRAGRWRPPAAAEAVQPTPPVGRESALAAALAVVSNALGGSKPAVLVITGDPGMGRSRLAAECVARVALDGGVVSQATLLVSDHDATWSTLRAILGGPAGLLKAPGAASADPAALQLLAGLPAGAAAGGGGEPKDHGEVACAFAALCAGIAEEQPVAIVVDDAQWADGASLDALSAGLAQMPPAPVLLIVTCPHATEPGPKELTRLRSEIGRRLRGETVRLAPLKEADLETLVAMLAPWCAEEEQRRRLTRRLAFETGGSPFLAVSLLESLRRASTLREDVLAWPRPGVTIDGPLPITVPELARLGVLARVTELESLDLVVLRTASVLGLAVDPALVAQLTGLAVDQVNDALGQLERARLLVFDGGAARFTFAAPLIADVVARECLLPGERRLVRQRAAAALAGREDLEARVLRAELLARVQPDREALALAAEAGMAAMAAGAVRTARRSLVAAERVSEALGSGESPQLAELRRSIKRVE